MKTKSAKAKGRKLQDWVRDLMRTVRGGDYEEIQCAIMGEKGADVKLTGEARVYFNWDIECKNREDFKGIYKYYSQAEAHGEGKPVLFIKSNKRKPLVIVDAEDFIKGKI
jgi:hypothetical protein